MSMKSQPVGKLLTVFVAGALTCLVFIHYFGAAYTVNGVNKVEDQGNHVVMQSASSSLTDYNAINTWARSIVSLKAEDSKRKDFLHQKDPDTVDGMRNKFYQVLNMPLQSICTSGKFFGGNWLSACGAFDGNKFVCLDKLYKDVLNGKCLIYSFGISGDWTFEVAMAELGCTIRAFDPTSKAAAKPDISLITFNKIGMKEFSGEANGLGPVLTLKDAIKAMGDEGKDISYLKVDIEGSELRAIPEWVSSGILDRVSQFGIEIHTEASAIPKEKIISGLGGLLDTIRQLYQLGFRLISNTNNDCVGKKNDMEKRYINLMELVFYKE